MSGHMVCVGRAAAMTASRCYTRRWREPCGGRAVDLPFVPYPRAPYKSLTDKLRINLNSAPLGLFSLTQFHYSTRENCSKQIAIVFQVNLV